MKNIICLFLVLVGCAVAAPEFFTQDKILTMSGMVINCQVTDDSQIVVKYTITNKRGKTKEKLIHKSEVFSIIKNGEETVLYAPDEVLGDKFSIEETRVFIAGEQDGYQYKTKRIEALGYIAGAAAGYLSKGNVIIVLLTPTLYTVYQYIPTIKVSDGTISDDKYFGNKIYLRGYEVSARDKRVKKAVKSSVIGTAFGVLLFRIFPYT